MIALPRQRDGVPWPTEEWAEGEVACQADRERLGRIVDPMFAAATDPRFGTTTAVLVVWRGRVVLERYGAGIEAETTLPSWSMAKSITHALVGLLEGDGALDLAAPAPVSAWRDSDDPRRRITLEHLMRMVDGLRFVEHDVAANRSEAFDMLHGVGKPDAAAYAEGCPLLHAPGTVFNYSSGTSIVVAAIVGRAVGSGRAGMESFLRERLLAPLGMHSACPRFDAAGTFLGSSYLYATARDFARFGLLYLRDGEWEGRRLLPTGWVDHARTPTLPSAGQYGAHWWLDVAEKGTFCAKGFQGQYLIVAPRRDLLVLRLGVSTEPQRERVVASLAEILASFPPTDD